MQLCFRDSKWSEADILGKIDNILESPRGMSEVFRARVNPAEARQEILLRSRGLASFGSLFLGKSPRVRHKYLFVTGL